MRRRPRPGRGIIVFTACAEREQTKALNDQQWSRSPSRMPVWRSQCPIRCDRCGGHAGEQRAAGGRPDHAGAAGE